MQNDNGIYYFLGNITSHILHALPLHKELGGTFVVLSKKAKAEVEKYGVPVITLDDKPSKLMRVGYKIKPVYHYIKIDRSLRNTTDFLNNNAKVVLFYELYDFEPSLRLTKPKTIFLTHGNMLKDYMSNNNRVEIIKQYDYMAAVGPYLKSQLIEEYGIPSEKLVDIGVARTDEVIKNQGKIVLSPALQKMPGFEPNKRIVSYLPTFWGPSSIYDTGLKIVSNMPEEYTLLFRPHPQTPQKLLNKYRNIIQSKHSVLFTPEGKCEGVGLIEIFDASSAIIGDVSSVMLEAVLTEKPLIFAYGQYEHRQSDDTYGALEGIVHQSQKITANNASGLAEILKKATSAVIDKNIWHSVEKNNFFNPNGTSVATMKRFVETLL